MKRETKLGILLFIALGLVRVVPAEGQTYQWVEGIGGNAVALGVNSSTGDVHVAGNFNGTADFDPGAGTANLTSNASSSDVFFAKYNSSGSYVWANRIGGSGFDYAMATRLDSSGNVYVLGYFEGTVDFDPGAGTTNLTAGGNLNGFLAKYSSTGALVWARAFTGTGFMYPQRMALDSSGNVVIVGTFINTIDFDPNLGTTNLTSSSNYNLFFAKYSSSGALILAANVDSTDSIYFPNVALDSSGNIYISARFSGTLDADPSSGVVSRSGPSPTNLLLAKYTSTGTHLWSRSIVGAENVQLGNCVAVDASGVYVTGAISASTDFGGTVIGTSGSEDVFLAKYSTANSLLWVKGMGGSGSDYGGSIALDAGGSVYLGGIFSGSGDFDPGAGVRTLTASGTSQDFFFGKYSSAGAYVWAYGLGDGNHDELTGVTLDSANNVYINGFFGGGTVDFNTGSGTATLSSSWSLGFFAKYSQPGPASAPATGPRLWLRADLGVTSSAGKVSAWADQSGFGNNATMATASRQPTVVTGTLNGLPIIRFGGAQSLVLNADVSPNNFTVFVVGKNSNLAETFSMILGPAGSSPNNQMRWANGTQALFVGSGNSLPATTSTIGNTRVYHALSTRYNGSAMTVYRDGGLTSSHTFTTTGPWTLRQVGAYYSSSFLIGDIAEILIYDRALTEAERDQTDSYLRTKYGLP